MARKKRRKLDTKGLLSKFAEGFTTTAQSLSAAHPIIYCMAVMGMCQVGHMMIGYPFELWKQGGNGNGNGEEPPPPTGTCRYWAERDSWACADSGRIYAGHLTTNEEEQGGVIDESELWSRSQSYHNPLPNPNPQFSDDVNKKLYAHKQLSVLFDAAKYIAITAGAVPVAVGALNLLKGAMEKTSGGE